MLKKVLALIFFILFFALPGLNASAQSIPGVNVYFFWGEGCPHCAKEELFLEKLEKKYPGVKVYDFEVWENAQNRKLLIEAGEKLQTNTSGVPFTVVGNRYFVGFYSDTTTGREIEEAAKYCLENKCQDLIVPSAPNKKEPSEKLATTSAKEGEKIINVPLLGEINALGFSLPMLAIIMGAIDGFNPCAMWALLFLISLLLGLANRKRMWLLGSAFIITSASVYFVFMAAWLNLILFIGLIVWVRIIIGLVALVGGSYSLKEYFSSRKEIVCQVTGVEKKRWFIEKLKNATRQKSFYLALGGVILLAGAVNLIELICSAGLPAVYTQVLTLSNLTQGQYYLYLLLYIFVFMLDDLIVFFAAMTTLQIAGATTKYSRWSRLIGGILMFVIGLLLIFKPSWLMFG